MEFIDLKAQYEEIKIQVNQNIAKVFEHGQYIMGPEVVGLEKKLADYVGVKHCVSCSSGTDAIMLALLACELKAGDEIIMTPFTFFATVEIPALLGIVPVYVDIDPLTYNIDAKLIEQAITSKTKAIMPVSLYGQCPDMDVINMLAVKYNLFVFEDAAQSFGATYKKRKSCGLSTIGCTSFFPSKPLGGYGDGGACFTNDEKLALAMRELSLHGQSKRYYHTRVGINGRLDTIQAAILLAKMDVFEQEVIERQRIAAIYDEALREKYTVPFVAKENTSVYGQYTIRVSNREQLQEKLKAAGVPTTVHYPTLLNEQPALIELYGAKNYDLRHAILAAKQVLSLPMSPYLSQADQKQVIDSLLKIV